MPTIYNMSTSFKSLRTHSVTVWSNPNQLVQKKWGHKCKYGLLMGHFIYEIDKHDNSNKTNKKLEISRVICGVKLLEEKIEIK